MTAAVRTIAVRVCFGVLLVAATSPAWRLLRLGAAPTYDELRQLGCSARPAAALVARASADPDDPRRPR